MNFDEAFDRLMVHEGGFVDDENDPGGATKWGVTEFVARSWGYTGLMVEFTLIEAKAIYEKQYWNPIRAAELPAALRYPVFDAAVNSGVKQAVRWLQRVLEVEDDGDLGPVTIKACWEHHPAVIAAAFIGHRMDMQTDLKNWPHHGKGWTRRNAQILKSLKGDIREGTIS